MNITISSPFELLQQLRYVEWPTKFGGIKYAISIFLITVITITGIHLTGLQLPSYIIIISLLAPQIIHLLLWLIKRNYFYDPSILTLAFAIKTEESSEGYYREMIKLINSLIITHKLDHCIKIKSLPTDIYFTDSKSTQTFILKNGIRLLIWGNTTEANFGESPISQFNIMVTYQYSSFGEKQRKEFANDISAAIKRKNLGIKQPESLAQLIVVSGNVFEISLYSFGMCLATVPDITYQEKSTEIIEALSVRLQKRIQDANFPNLDVVKNKVRNFLLDQYSFLSLYANRDKKDLKLALTYAEKALALDVNNYYCNHNLAYYLWLTSEQDQALHYATRAWKIRPSDPRSRFNKAFFHIINHRFDKALREYKKIRSLGAVNIVELIEFLESEFDKQRDNLGLLFASGWLNIRFADHARGLKLLKNFIAQAGIIPEYSYLVNEANELVKNTV